jgi:transcriptional regulator with XRE-family HTH domain
MMKKDDFLEIIKANREQLKLSQNELAQRLAITQSQYGKLESGKSEMTLEKFVEICNLLNLKIEDFIREQPNKREETIKKIIELLNII